jgi:FkbM family methyltransferase
MRAILSQVFNLLVTIYQEYRSLLWHFITRFSKSQSLKVHKNLTLKLTNYGYVTKRIFQQQLLVSFKRSFEFETLAELRSLVKPDFQILDIGANIGLHALVMAQQLSEKGKIYAFEPSKKTFNALTENIKLNNLEEKVTAFNLALSNKSETLFLAAPEAANISDADADAYNSLHAVQTSRGNAEEIQAITLDSWMAEGKIGKIDLIKIDIEGAELLCFEGAKAFFNTNKPIIVMECYEAHLKKFNHSIFDVLHFLSQFGYTFEEQADANWLALPH